MFFVGKIKKELNLLSKLYSLYNTVIDTVNGYYDILWMDIDIEKINDELTDFQNRYNLPSYHGRTIKYIITFN